MANIFPKWSNTVPLKVVIALTIVVITVCLGTTYYATPKYLRVGYQPKQPVAFSHRIHADQLGIDCRYCHSSVDQSEHSLIPDAETCMNCHKLVKNDSPALEPVRHSYETGEPIPWVRIHEIPDYVFFNHAVHVNRGVSCIECHGEIHKMDEVYHAKGLSMHFCLECHRDPTDKLRPLDRVYDLNWKPKVKQSELPENERFIHKWNVDPPESCSGCHR